MGVFRPIYMSTSPTPINVKITVMAKKIIIIIR